MSRSRKLKTHECESVLVSGVKTYTFVRTVCICLVKLGEGVVNESLRVL